MSQKDYVYVLSIQDKKLSIKNKKYINMASASSFFPSHIKHYFYEYDDLSTLNIYSFIKTIKAKGKLSQTINDSKTFAKDIPLWVLEYKEIWDMVKDNIKLAFLPNSKPTQPATPEKIKTLFKIDVGTKTVNIDGQIQTMWLNLGYNADEIVTLLKDKKPLPVNFFLIKYKNAGVTNSYPFTGVHNNTINNNGLVILDEYQKVVKPDKKLNEISKYFDNLKNYPRGINNPEEITYDNLITLFKKYHDIINVSFGQAGARDIKWLNINEVISNFTKYSLTFIEKLIEASDEGLMIHNNNIYIFDVDQIKSSMDKLTDLFISKDFRDFIKEIKNAGSFKKVDETVIKKLKENEDFKAQLYPHQELGTSWIYNLYKNKIPGALLADDLGLGKTLQTIAFLSLLSKNKSITIIATATLVGNWENEIEKFNPELLKHHKIKILSYERALRANIGKTDILILDEAQKIKNNKTEMFKSISSIKKEFSLILTGTPIENGLDDIINILSVIDPVFQKLKVLKKFNKNSGHFVVKLRTMIDPIYLQRKKSEIQNINLDSELVQNPIYINPDPYEEKLLKEIKKIYQDKLLKLNAQNNFEFYAANMALAGLQSIRQAISYAPQLPEDLKNLLSPKLKTWINTSKPSKYKELVKQLKSLKDKKEKAVIFGMFIQTISFLETELKKQGFKVITLTGSDSSAKRKAIVESFQQGVFDIIIISLKAGNAGITLTEANNVFIYDLWYNPQVLAQAIARVHRIGQNKDVQANFLILKNTFDDQIYNILYSKRKLIDSFENFEAGKVAKDFALDFFDVKDKIKKIKK